jgi:mono/diheme cytochrome c family protein
MPVDGRWYTTAQVERGRGLYLAHCAACHATDGSATAQWRTPGTDGHYPPPPLNGTAHTWHHPIDVLDDTIANGGARFGGVMPGFSSVLDDRERLAVIAWIQSLWPDDIYAKWQNIDLRAR